jgi:hypothetical protein
MQAGYQEGWRRKLKVADIPKTWDNSVLLRHPSAMVGTMNCIIEAKTHVIVT